MSSFKRGISSDFVAALNEEYERNSWWTKIVDDHNLFVAIRDEYINVYYKGNSLIRLDFNKGEFIAKTHYKYLVKPNLNKNENCLIKTTENMAFIPESSKGTLDYYLTKSLYEIESIKKASTAYGGIEKEGIQKILNSNINIIDLEVALTKTALQSEDDIDKDSAKRIDFAAIHENAQSQFELVFFEAKHYSNKELRAKGNALPAVLKKQIPTYEKLLDQYESDIKTSYKRVCKNLIDLLPNRSFTKSIIAIANGADFNVNFQPRLVIFGFDDDQKKGNIFKTHIKKLNDTIGKKRVLLKGDPKDFVRGISYPK